MHIARHNSRFRRGEIAQPASALASLTPGERLRALRKQRRLSLRDVQEMTITVARKQDSFEFVVFLSELSQIETHGRVPGLHRLRALAEVYAAMLVEMLSWFGIDKQDIA